MSSIRCGKRKRRKSKTYNTETPNMPACQSFSNLPSQKKARGEEPKKNKKEAKGNNSKDQSSSLVSFSPLQQQERLSML
tara:strand:- start:1102 stop:1338 length:237 start_codon:yes stop_codon:yes gene_type:complete